MKLTIDDYSKHFKMSKEMINSKLKAKKLDYVIEDGITYIVRVDAPIKKEQPMSIKKAKVANSVVLTNQQKQKTTVAAILSLYQKENQQLKAKILQLEAKVDKLVDDKEQMLRDERDKIEDVYQAKDEQLKTILELISTKIIVPQPEQIVQKELPKEIKKIENVSKLVELREYLKTLDLKSHQRKNIKKKFIEVYDSDIRIIQQNGKLYLDLFKYDYSDLLSN